MLITYIIRLGPLAIPAKKKIVREKKAKEKAEPAKLVQPKTVSLRASLAPKVPS